MIPILITFLTRLFALIGGLARFLRAPRPLPTPAEAAPASPVAAPSALSEIEARLDAQIAEFDQWEREYNREQRAYRKLLRDQARARGELPPAKPRKPREPQPKTQPKSLSGSPRAVAAAPKTDRLSKSQIKPQHTANSSISSLSIASRPTPSQATPSQAIQSDTTPPRTLFKTLSTLLIAPLRILKTALLALPRLFMGLFSRRRPPFSGPPGSLPSTPSLQNRAA